MSAPIRAILYDYGNVLVGWSPRSFYEHIILDPERLNFFLDQVCPMSWHMLHDLGQPMAVTIPKRQELYPEFAREIAAWKTHFGQMITGEITGTTALVAHLATSSIPQYVLTNMPSEMVETCFGSFDFPKYFQDVIVSGDEKAAKPERLIFDIALKRMGGLKAKEVFFTDDSPANIDAARSFGFVTHLFERPEGLKMAMQEVGLPV
ncbi:HAD-IA family hydrolase [Candidatus Phycosocius spiralis]|uniref:Haloacid dehalogenase n=1 Tax=Candidatus Phycosocius spiralis TaxID=2815099 RepID=A0ABQ4PT76_9PROT|nr:HAD-IA family hydrolase [Candidatus Phycosocius spiralis]GIU66181.1 haloacid dehalogenase [Candidatus Phycosocius spiralis]